MSVASLVGATERRRDLGAYFFGFLAAGAADDDADVAGDEEDLGALTPTDARSPAEVPVWKFWARE